MSGPLFDALRDSAIAREDVHRAASARSETFHKMAGAIARGGVGDAQGMVRTVVRAGMIASLAGFGAQTKAVKAELTTEADALAKQDPRTVPALRDVDIAQRRADKMDAAKAGT